MSKLFSYNAFATLGVDTSSSQKEVIKQSKKIIVILQNDDEFDYDYDLGTINKVPRTEASVNNAVQRLSSPIKRIKEYFFWFEIENDEDENNLKLLKDSKFDEALESWKARAKKSHTSKRNLAIASSILLNHTGYKKYSKLSIDAWKEILDSDKFWVHFEKVYELNDEIGSSKTALNDFREKVTDYLSDFYTDVSRSKKDNSIYAAFNSAFGVKGQKMQDEVLGPIFERINNTSKHLRELKVSEDGVLSRQEVMAIKRLAKILQDSFQEIKDLGLYEDSHVKVMRDKAAEAVSTVSVDLYNNLGEFTKSSELDKIALSFASGPAVISRIKKDIETTQQKLLLEKIIKPINNFMENEQYEEALELLNYEQSKNKNDESLQIYFTKRIQWCVTSIASQLYKDAMRQFEKDNYADAKQGFIDLNTFILSYLNDFNFDQDSLNSVLAHIDRLTGDSKLINFADIDSYRKQVLDDASETFKDQFEQSILVYLIDCGIYINLSTHIPTIRRRNSIKKWSWYAVIGIGILVWIVIGTSSSNTPSTDTGASTTPNANSSTSPSVSAKQAAYDACSAQYKNLKSQLDSVEAQMASYDAANNVDAYNNLVPQQNSLVRQVNNKATECNNLR